MKILTIDAIASVQDLGRVGQRKHGIGISGAMDAWALRCGNVLLGNDENTAAIEITFGGMKVVFAQDTHFCITGAEYEAYIISHNNQVRKQVKNAWRTFIRKGEILELKRAKYGMFSYLCVEGGFDIAMQLGSASTNVKANFGGWNGRLLQQNDEIPLRNKHDTVEKQERGIASNKAYDYLSEQITTIRILPNSEYEAFTNLAKTRLVEGTWVIQSSSNRMGYRLQFTEDKELNVPLSLEQPLQMESHGVDKGMIQVPPDGQPIVLMADTQTTGGYPKIASIINADLGKFAQLRFGKKCRFQWVTLEEAIRADQKQNFYIQQIRSSINGELEN